MMYKITKKDVFDDNPELRSIPEFDKLTDRQMKFVIFVYDYKSPFRNLPMEQRKKKAALQAGFKWSPTENRPDRNTRDIINGNVTSVEHASHKYMELQFDEDYENLKAYDEQLSEIREFFKKKEKSVDEMNKALAMMKAFKGLIIDRKELIKALGIREEEEEVDDVNERELSTIDVINQEMFD